MNPKKLEVRKFRTLYTYAFDDSQLHFSWRKGKKKIQETYSLADISSTFGYWKGYPQSTKRNLAIAGALLVIAVGLVYGASALWMLICSFILFAIALEVVYGEVGFLLPNESTVLSYRDGSDCLYLKRTTATDIERLAFELVLREAIVKAEQEKHNPALNTDLRVAARPSAG